MRLWYLQLFCQISMDLYKIYNNYGLYRNFQSLLMYGFFKPCPTIEVVDGCRCHEFQCATPLCRGKGVRPRIVRRYLDKADLNSTSNMHKHVKNCWGDESVRKALKTKGALSIEEVHKSLGQAKLKDRSIMASFERKGKGSVTFSTRQHTYSETRLVNNYF